MMPPGMRIIHQLGRMVSTCAAKVAKAHPTFAQLVVGAMLTSTGSSRILREKVMSDGSSFMAIHNKSVSSRISFSHILFLLIAILFIFICEVPAQAMQSRAELIASQQAEKAKSLHPFEPSKAQRILERVQRLPAFGATPSAFYPALGSAYRTGSFAAGLGYYNRFSESGIFSAVGLWSIRNYKLAEVNLHLPELADEKIKIDAVARYLDAPKIPFYGVGNNSDPDDKTQFLYRPITFGATGTIAPAKWFSFGGGVDYLDIQTDEGDITNDFSPLVVPGLGTDPTYTLFRGFVNIDWRTSPGYSTKGGWYHVEYYDYDQTNEGNFSFQQVDAEVRQMIPILRANWIIVLRALTSLTYTDEGQVVPFYMMPNLGGGRELRGYPDFFFRDNNKILYTAEYRWTPSKFMDMALFYELGKVTPDRSEITEFDGLHYSYGIGARFHGPISTPLRIEVAFSEDFTRFIFAFSPAL